MSAAQLNLLDYQPYGGSPGHRGVDTQRSAAKKVKPHVGPMQARIVNTIEIYGPMTRQEIADTTKMRLQSVCGRVRELVLMGILEDSPEIRNGGHLIRRRGNV